MKHKTNVYPHTRMYLLVASTMYFVSISLTWALESCIGIWCARAERKARLGKRWRERLAQELLETIERPFLHQICLKEDGVAVQELRHWGPIWPAGAPHCGTDQAARVRAAHAYKINRLCVWVFEKIDYGRVNELKNILLNILTFY